jgi:O-methyltransferase
MPLRKSLDFVLGSFGYDLVRRNPSKIFPVEATPRDRQILELVQGYTMTTPERIWALLTAVKYVAATKIPGAFVECGVWRGGSAMAMAYALQDCGETDRRMWLFDTFEGMTPPSTADVELATGRSASSLLEIARKDGARNIWCDSPVEEVTNNLLRTGFPMEHIQLVKGDVLETLQQQVPEEIALLRLDTDWYESTKAELEVLYPRLQRGGVCIVDDYGYWGGSKKAVDEYLASNDIHVLLHRIDETGRMFIKP